MKKLLNFVPLWLILVNVVVINSTCKKENQEAVPQGKLQLSVGISILANDVYNQLKAATDDFTVKIFTQNGDVVETFVHASEIPETVDLPIGNYYVVATSGLNTAAAFDLPYYEGNSGNFTIQAAQTTIVEVPCKLANSLVTIIYSTEVIASFSNFSTLVSNDLGSLVFNKTETRAGYFSNGPLHIESTLYYTDGTGNLQTKTLSDNILDFQVGKHYEVHIDAKLNQTNSVISITLDETSETIIVNISDEPTNNGVLSFGNLIITELIPNPLILSDTEGEWIELYNTTNHEINLKDLVIRRGSNNSFHKIATDVLLPSLGFAVLARSLTAASTVNYVYGSGITLPNTDEEIIINTFGTNGTDGTVICSVNYGAVGFPGIPNGKSLQLNPTVQNATDAQLGTNWCIATALFSTGDYGTPGATNSNCN